MTKYFRISLLMLLCLAVAHPAFADEGDNRRKRKGHGQTAGNSVIVEPDRTPLQARQGNEMLPIADLGGAGSMSTVRGHGHLNSSYRQGIDVSHYQYTIDWERLAANENISYAYIKATEGSNLTDEYYRQNLEGAHRVGISVGSYHFYRPNVNWRDQLELMKRIVLASTEEGDLAGDFFCGSGSLPEAAQMLGRRWIGCDSEEIATSMARRRLRKAGAEFDFIRQEEVKPLSGRADVAVMSVDPLEDGRKLYKCRLIDIVPDIDTGSVQMKDRMHVEEALKADRLQFADHVLVDPEYKGSFEAAYVFDADSGEMSFISGGDFAAVVVDIFGKEYEAEIVNEQIINEQDS